MSPPRAGRGSPPPIIAFLIYQRALLEFNVGTASAAGVIAIVLANIVAIFLVRTVARIARRMKGARPELPWPVVGWSRGSSLADLLSDRLDGAHQLQDGNRRPCRAAGVFLPRRRWRTMPAIQEQANYLTLRSTASSSRSAADRSHAGRGGAGRLRDGLLSDASGPGARCCGCCRRRCCRRSASWCHLSDRQGADLLDTWTRSSSSTC